MKEAKKTLLRVIVLIWILAAAVLLVGLVVFVVRPFSFFPYFLGEMLGSAISVLLMLHRYSTLDVELDLERSKAQNHLKLMASLRSLAALAALFLSFKVPWLFSPVTTFTGLFATKAAALLYSVVFRENTVLTEEGEENEFPAGS